MRQYAIYIIFSIATFVCTALIFSCLNNRANADVESKASNKNYSAISLAGKYQGELPCADCTAISTTLTLNQDRTYFLSYVYVGKSDQTFEKSGVWNSDKDILHLENEDYTYKIAGKKLNQLDLSGKEIKGDLADKYVLEKVVE